MNSRKKLSAFDWIIIIAFISSIIVVPLLVIKNANKEIAQHKEQIEYLYGDVYFSGSVAGFHKIKHSGMPEATVICIKIDTCNVDSFYHFDKYTALKINSGIVTFPIGGVGTDDDIYKNVVYVNVNEAGSHKMLFVNSQNDTHARTLYYTSEDLKEDDMRICDSCR